ncbi:MAG: divergent polysaccharide deacetylase family protein [Spirochaetales bacterium]|nr:divergent polysaccharide deacetylase family protein [Spirochaetales bacterium]MDY5916347.1 divergent polysaccharide deacetylase family protein [Treponema sp.]
MQNNKKKRKAKKSRKPKVYIPPYKIIILCSIVIVICMSLLLVTTIKSSENPQNSSIQNRYQQTEVTQKENSSDKKKDVPAKAEKKSKEENVKKAESGKTDNQKKTDNSKDKSESKKQDKQSADKTETSKSQKNETKKADKSENSVSAMTEVPAENKPETTQKTQTTQTKKSSGAESQNLEKKENQNSAKDENKKTQEDKNQKVPEASKPDETKKIEKKADKFDFPLAKNHAQLIFVFDDGGQNLAHLESFLKLPIPITIAVLPRLVHSVESAQKIRNSGNELILHQPMQALNSKVNPGPGAITPQMSEDEIIATLFYNINEIGPIAGMNNHEGSAITADAEKMAVILKMANEEGIYFLDSRTNSETKVPYVANLMGYSYYERNIFLDNEKTNENALQELKKGLAIANINGSVIMIGHIWSASFLPDFLLEVIPELQEKGYTFCTVSTSNAQKF